jgi:hypothetical protein
MDTSGLAKAQAVYNIASGLWPVVHRRSFERLLGPKQDFWLVHTVAALLVANGIAQWSAGADPSRLGVARNVGLGTAASLCVIDFRYAITGRISRVYLVDAAVEIGWIALWLRGGLGTGAGDEHDRSATAA